MAGPDRSNASGLTLERIEAILKVAKWLKEPPALPERDKGLWRKVQAKARRKARAGVSLPPYAEGARGPGRTKSEERRLLRDLVEEQARPVAESMYAERDPAYAEAVTRWREEINDQIKQFDLLLTPIRGEIPKLGIGPVHEFLSKPLNLSYVHRQGKTRKERDRALIEWKQDELHARFQQEADQIIHDLERMREAAAARAEAAQAGRSAGSESEPTGGAARIPSPSRGGAAPSNAEVLRCVETLSRLAEELDAWAAGLGTQPDWAPAGAVEAALVAATNLIGCGYRGDSLMLKLRYDGLEEAWGNIFYWLTTGDTDAQQKLDRLGVPHASPLPELPDGFAEQLQDHIYVRKLRGRIQGLAEWVRERRDALSPTPTPTPPEPLTNAASDAPMGVLRLDCGSNAIYLDGVRIIVSERCANAFAFLRQLCLTPNVLVSHKTINALHSGWDIKTTRDARDALRKGFRTVGRQAFFRAAVKSSKGFGYEIRLKDAPAIEGDAPAQ